MDEQDIDALVYLLEQDAVVLNNLPKIKVVNDDPDDDMILACAMTAEADYIVSGDRHLLDLRSFGNIPIITVKEFLRILN